ncbi:MAG TPA: hypothetical protein VH593_20275 [Ktedonobacteraceae bacterium]
MAQFLSNYLAGVSGTSGVLAWLKGTTFPAAPANTYVALLTTAPTDRAGTSAVEVSGSAYARQAIASSGWSSIGTSGSGVTTIYQVTNSSTINFPTATGSWGTVVGIALYDALTTGNLLAYGDLSSSLAVASGDTFQIPANDLVFQMK